jgi:hypothetical protein
MTDADKNKEERKRTPPSKVVLVDDNEAELRHLSRSFSETRTIQRRLLGYDLRNSFVSLTISENQIPSCSSSLLSAVVVVVVVVVLAVWRPVVEEDDAAAAAVLLEDDKVDA